ncbi:MAG TPA: hypothetical protein VGN11_02190, partial [Candidatus Baltobacteraceae bacterium]|nr:hypothetical protein [Candidatus Baltobacteraceae bacterium]
MTTAAKRLLAGRYKLDEELGEGAMSTVYRADDRLLGRAVAVKVLRAAFADDNVFVQRFYLE